MKNGWCPLLDSGPPKGDVWVQVRKAQLPYRIIDMGAGAEGLARLKVAQEEVQNLTPTQRRDNAVKAFKSGQGDLLDDLKANTIKSIYKPTPVEEVNKVTIIGCIKRAIATIWHSANLSD